MRKTNKLILSLPLLFVTAQSWAGAISTSSLTTYIQVGGLATSTRTFAIEVASAVSHGFGEIDINMDNWALMEPTRAGGYSASVFSNLLFKVNLATAAGLNVNLQIPINNSNGWLTFNFSTTPAPTDPLLGAIPYTHYLTSETVKISALATKIAQTMGISTKVKYRIWNEPDLSYSFYDGHFPPMTTTYINVLSNARAAIFTALAPSTPTVNMGGISTPQGYGTLEGYATSYFRGSWPLEFVNNGGGAYTSVWDLHCYGDANCTMVIVNGTTTLMNALYGSSKPVRVGEAGSFGGSYPTSNHDHEDLRNVIWLETACVQAIGTYGFQSFQVQPLSGTDQAIMTSTFTDKVSGTAWLNFVSVMNDKTWIRDRNDANLAVSEWRNATTGRKAWKVNSQSGTKYADFVGKPQRSNVYNSYGTLLISSATAGQIATLSVSSQAITIQELLAPGFGAGRQ